MYLVISLLVLRAGLYQFLIIAYLFTLNVKHVNFDHASPPCRGALKRARSKMQER